MAFLFLVTARTFAIDISPENLAEGDIIFHQSQTAQASAVKEATESVWTHMGILVTRNQAWYVAEATGPLKITPLKNFIARSKGKAYRVMRFKYYKPEMAMELYKTLQKYNQPYDIYFEFSDSRIYCSELVHKVFKDVTGYTVGKIQRVKDLKLDGPFVKAIIAERLTPIGKELNLEEPIVTPVSILQDRNVTLVKDSY